MKNKIWKWLLNNWTRFAEIAVVIWAINGMWQEIKPELLLELSFSRGPGWLSVLFYFLSVVLILYLLRRYETRNPQICR